MSDVVIGFDKKILKKSKRFSSISGKSRGLGREEARRIYGSKEKIGKEEGY